MSIVLERTTALGYGFLATYTPGDSGPEINTSADAIIHTADTQDFNQPMMKTGITFSAPTGDNNVQTANITLDDDEVALIGTSSADINYKFIFRTTYQDDGVTANMSKMGGSVDARKNIQLRLSLVAGSQVALDNAARFTIENLDYADGAYTGLSTEKDDLEIVLIHADERNLGFNEIPFGSAAKIASFSQVTDSPSKYIIELAKQAPPSDGASTATDIANNIEYEISVRGKTNKGGHFTLKHGATIKVTPSNIPVQPSLAISTNLSGGAGTAPDDTDPTQLTITWNDVPDENLGDITVDYGRWNSAATQLDGTAYSYTNDVEGYFYNGAIMSLDTDQVAALKTAGDITVVLPLDKTFDLADVSDNAIKIACIVSQTVNGNTLSSAPQLIHAYNPTMPAIEFGHDGTTTIGADNQITLAANGNQTIKFKAIALWRTVGVHTPDKTLDPVIKVHRPNKADITVQGSDVNVDSVVDETSNTPQTVKYSYTFPWAKILEMDGVAGHADRELTMSIQQVDPNDATKSFTRTTDRVISILKTLAPVAGTVGMTAVNTADKPPVVVRTGTDTVYDYTLKTLKLEGLQAGDLKCEIIEDQSEATDLSTDVAFNGDGQELTKNVTSASAYTASTAITSKLTSTYHLAHSNDWYGAIPDKSHTVNATDTDTGSGAVLLFQNPEITGVTVSGQSMTVAFDTKGASFDNTNGHMPLTAYALVDNNEGTHFETVTQAVDLTSAGVTNVSGFQYTTVVTFNGNIVTNAGHGFMGLVHLDSSNANSDLKIVQS